MNTLKLMIGWFVFAFFSIACGESADHSQPSSPAGVIIEEAKRTDLPEQRIEVDGELKAQLEAAGYVVKTSSTPKSLADNPYANADVAGLMEGTEGTFVFLDVKRNVELVHNEERAAERFSPCSTYKIPHTLIALETGVAESPQQKIAWNQATYPKEPWWDTMLAANGMHWDRDHTLTTAFQNSCVWYYRETAKKVGPERMKTFLAQFDYGNRDISSGIDSFWLGGSLKISAKEQIIFLKRFLQSDLHLSVKTVLDAKQVFEKERRDGSVLYAKTGGGENIGWYVGFVETPENQYIFAFNMPGAFAVTFHKRVDTTMAILSELGVWIE